MLKTISKILVAGAVAIMVQSAFSMEIYTVKPNDYLYKIASSHAVKGISSSELTDAIKGINKSEIPGIVDNRIRVGDKLAIPTTKNEVEDGLTLVRNQMMQGSYNKSTDNSNSLENGASDGSNLSDQSMLSSKASKVDKTKNQSMILNTNQENIPTLIPGDNEPVTYKNSLDNQISSDNVQETASYDSSSSFSSFFSSIFKFVLYILVLVVVFVVAKKFWESRNSKKEQELEILSKKKRDHLMSRISPVVSDSGFYSSNKGPQEEFDFFGNSSSNINNRSFFDSESSQDKELEEDDINTPDDESDDIYSKHDTKNIAIKTEKGVIFETSSNESLGSMEDNDVEEIDAEEHAEQELQYIEELIEQYLESEKYVEASITIQDSLEKDPNNIDLRYRLLEVYARAGDEIAFEGEVHFIKSKNIVSMFDPLHQKIAKLRDKYFE